MIRHLFDRLGRLIWARLDRIYNLDTEVRGDDLADQLIAEQLDPFDRAAILGAWAIDPRIGEASAVGVQLANGHYLAMTPKRPVWRLFGEHGVVGGQYWYSLTGQCGALPTILGEPQEAEVRQP